MKEKFKQIIGYEDYEISNYGRVISHKNGNVLCLKPFLDSLGRYYMVSLCNENGIKKFSIHRLVATYFCTKKKGKNVVNHKDHNTHNNYYKNLEWTTTRENVWHSYSTMGPVRNTRKCRLIYPSGEVFEFNSFPELIKHKEANNLKFSELSLRNNGHSQGYRFEKL